MAICNLPSELMLEILSILVAGLCNRDILALRRVCRFFNSIVPDLLPKLCWPAFIGDQRAVRLLLENGTDIDARDNDGGIPLHWAAAGGSKGVVQQLLAKGADINAESRNGGMPLHRAARNGHGEVVLLLLEKGVNIEARGWRRMTPLHHAAMRGHETTVGLLLEKNASITAKDTNGETPMHKAARGGHNGVVQLLLDFGSGTEAKDNDGWTSLHEAARGGHEEVVQQLLKRGADVRAKTKNGQISLDFAVRDRNEPVACLLQSQAANAQATGTNRETVSDWTSLTAELPLGSVDIKTRTGQQLIQELLDYDPRRSINRFDNFAMGSPRRHNFAVHQSNSLQFKHASSCHHTLILKPEQSNFLPDNFYAASPATVASCCATCLSHFTFVLDTADQTLKNKQSSYAVPSVHYFQYSSRQSPQLGDVKSKRWTEKHCFECSAPHCPAILLVYISPPRLDAEDLKFLTDENDISARGQEVIGSGRYAGLGPRSPGEALRYFLTYLRNILDVKARRFPGEDKDFCLAFGGEPLKVFKRLGFPIEELETRGLGLAPIEPGCLLQDNVRNGLMDVRYELSLRLRDFPGHRREDPFFPLPALPHVERILTSGGLGNL